MPQGRRDKLDIFADILRGIRKNSRKTHVVYDANLNFKRCKNHLQTLLDRNLVTIQENSPLSWTITEKGEEFLEKYNEIREMVPR